MGRSAHAQLDAPTLAGIEGRSRLSFEPQRTHLGHLRPQAHGHDVAFAPAVGGEGDFDRREFGELICRPVFDEGAGGIGAANG